MTPFSVAGIQMHVTGEADNVPAMRAQLQTLMTRFPWIRMVVFSELAACGGGLHLAQTLPGPAEAAFQEIAATHGIWLLPGSIFEKAEDGQIYNTASVIDPSGRVVARYRKLFPFCPYEAGVTAGDNFCVFDVPAVGRFGVSICYDSWFPEVARTLTALGAEVLLQPVLTDTIDREIELSIARATAAQFQAYVVNINGVGDGGVGQSCIVDPAGYVLHQAGSAEIQIPVEIDLDLVRRQRETGIRGLGQVLKSFRDRRVDFSVYDRKSGLDASLRELGPLRMPGKAN